MSWLVLNEKTSQTTLAELLASATESVIRIENEAGILVATILLNKLDEQTNPSSIQLTEAELDDLRRSRSLPMTTKSRKQQIEEMLALEPNDPELRYMLAMEHASLGDDAQSARCFQELIAVAPEYPLAYHMGARTLVRLNRVAEACALLHRGIPVALRQNNQHAAGEMQELLASLQDE